MMKLTSLKQSVVAGAAALTLVGASLGVAAAQQAPTASPGPATTAPAGPRQGAPGQQQADRQQREQQFVAALAARLGIPADRLQQAMDQTRTDLGIQERGGPNRGDQRQGGGPNGGQRIGGGLDAAAQAHNVDPTTVTNALKAAANARIDQEAAAGRVPADQVAAAKQQAAQRIDQMMTQVAPAGGPGNRPAPAGGARSSQ